MPWYSKDRKHYKNTCMKYTTYCTQRSYNDQSTATDYTEMKNRKKFHLFLSHSQVTITFVIRTGRSFLLSYSSMHFPIPQNFFIIISSFTNLFSQTPRPFIYYYSYFTRKAINLIIYLFIYFHHRGLSSFPSSTKSNNHGSLSGNGHQNFYNYCMMAWCCWIASLCIT